MPNSSKRSDLKIRRARSGDAARLAALSGELGYPATVSEIKNRMSRLKAAGDNALFVADSDGEVVGWLHVSASNLLEVPRRAEVNGLVVAEQHRSLGAGARLLGAAETWARKKKCANMSVRSKTQKAFRKPL